MTNYTQFLQAKLQDRLRANPQYSMRAFAKSLGVDPGYLSHLFAGRRKLSLDRAIVLSEKLKLEVSEKELFFKLVQLSRANPEQSMTMLDDLKKSFRLDPIHEVKLDHFEVISEWYYFAILELTFDRTERLTPKLISKRLGLSQSAARLAIDKLLGLGFLHMDAPSGHLRKTERHIQTPNEIASAGIKKRHKQVLARAQEAIESQATADRSFQGVTLNLDPDLLPEAKKRIQKFMWELCEFLESGQRQEVYELSLQLFSLEQRRSKK